MRKKKYSILHILAMLIQLITFGLLLDFIFRGNSFFSTSFSEEGQNLIVLIFFLASILLGSLSIILLFDYYSKEKNIEQYLWSILLTEILAIIVNFFLIMV